jgi:hypothetical protein
MMQVDVFWILIAAVLGGLLGVLTMAMLQAGREEEVL